MTRFALRGILGRKLRTALTAIAVVLGVAMVSGTFVLTDSISKAFDAIFTESYRGTDAVITGKSAFDLNNDNNTGSLPSFDESLLEKVRGLPDVRAALGGVAAQAHLIGKNGKAIVFGGAPNFGFSVDPSQPSFNSLTLVDGAWPKPGEVVVDRSTAGKKHLAVGDTVGVQAQGPVVQFRISGLVKFGAVSTIGGATLAGFDLASAQSLFDKQGKLDDIRLAAKDGVSPEKLVAEVREILPPETQVRSGASQATSDAKDTNSFITFLQSFLLAFGGIALFVGSFVIANSLSITIAQRMREFATLRTLGASRKQVLASVIIEALVMGVLASLVGLFLGLALARGLFSLFDAVGFTLPNNGLTFETRTIVVSLLVGIVITLLASLRPAFRATRVPPIAAVREGAVLPPGRFARFRAGGALGTAGLGFASLLLGLFGHGLGTTGVLAFMGLGALLIFFGVALFSSRLVGPLVQLIVSLWAMLSYAKAFVRRLFDPLVRPIERAISWIVRRVGRTIGVVLRPILSVVRTAKRGLGRALLLPVRGVVALLRPVFRAIGAFLLVIGRVLRPVVNVVILAGRVLVFPARLLFRAIRYLLTRLARLVGVVLAKVAVVIAAGLAPVFRPLKRLLRRRIRGRLRVRHPNAMTQLAADNATRNPQRTASTAAALMIGLALVTLVATLAAGIIKPFEDAVNKIFTADYAITAQNNFDPIPISVGKAAASTPGIEAISGVRGGDGRVFGAVRFVTAVDPAVGRTITIVWTSGSDAVFASLGANGAFVDDGFAKKHKLTVGSPIPLLTPKGETLHLVLRGIFKPPTGGSPFGAVTISSSAFDAHYDQPQDLYTFISMRGGVTDANTVALTNALKSFPNAKAVTRDQFKKNQISGLKSVLNILYVLLALSVVVSLFGIVNTLVLTVFERTREIGMLRAIGMTRRQTRQMIRHESVITALIGAVLGIVLGLVLGGLLTARVKEIVFVVPVGQVIIFTIAAIFVGIVAAIFPARRAASLNPLEALHYE